MRNVREVLGLPLGIVGIFVVIWFLYDGNIAGIWYALLLSLILLGGIGGLKIRKQRKKEKMLKEERDSLEARNAGECILPAAGSNLEKEYQELVRSLEELCREIRSEERIGRQEMSDFYGMWVHQIKTPIAAMQLMLQSADSCAMYRGAFGQAKEEKAEKEDPEEKEDLGVIAEMAFEVPEETDSERETEYAEEARQRIRELKMELFRIERYVEMVLTYLRVEDMSSDLSFDLCDLDQVLHRSLKKYSQMFILKKIHLEYQLVCQTVLTDEKWLQFVLEQLLSNAVKYCKREGNIKIYREKKDGRTVLVIEDDGIGIQAEDLPRVFEKGFTGFNGRSDKKSTGIGLYLCKKVFDRLRHRIWVESEPGKGTKVFLDFYREELEVE